MGSTFENVASPLFQGFYPHLDWMMAQGEIYIKKIYCSDVS